MVAEYDYLVVGAGLYGCTIAERIANDMKKRVLLIDKRDHIGGNCHSRVDPETGIEYHLYGTHIFHTSHEDVWRYVNRFTEFNGYHHQVLTVHDGRVYQLPINLETINAFYGLNLNPTEAKLLIEREIGRDPKGEPQNLEEKAVQSIGRPLYDAFIKEYTRKQWGKDPRELSPAIIGRLPVRYSYNEDYFHDCRWQGIPLDGFAAMFEKMVSSPLINVQLGCDFFDVRHELVAKEMTVYTGPIDQYFEYCFGRLEWRAVKFEQTVLSTEDFQGTAVMNFADGRVAHTRIHEPRHLHPERTYRSDRTLVIKEWPDWDCPDPYYPVNTEANKKKFQLYKKQAASEARVIIDGRLGGYAYYDMDRTILAALSCYNTRIHTVS